MLRKTRSILYIASILLVSSIISTATPIKTVDTEDEFLDIIDQKKPAIIMGSMDHCSHCKNIDPTFETLAKKHKKISFYKANGPSIKMHEHVKRESKGKFQIPGYPVFIFIKNKRIASVLIGGAPESLESAIKEFEKKCD